MIRQLARSSSLYIHEGLSIVKEDFQQKLNEHLPFGLGINMS